jgi:hypothetical protein
MGMNDVKLGAVPADPGNLSTRELVKALLRDVTELIRTEVSLARAEVKRDLKVEASAAIGLGIAGLLGLIALVLLFVTAILALGHVMPDWAAGLLVTAVVLAAGVICAAVAWSRRVRKPLARTRHEAQATLALARGHAS